MNIGIIVHSLSGHTLEVAEYTQTELQEAGHTVTIERVTVANEDPQSTIPLVLESNPSTEPYEGVILAAPVRAFGMSPVMKKWLEGRPQLGGKPTLCIVTQHFKYKWLGGNNALKQMGRMAQSHGASVLDRVGINWSNAKRVDQIEELKQRATQAFT